MAAPAMTVTMIVNRASEYSTRAHAALSAVVRETAFALEAAIKVNIVRVNAVDTGNLLGSPQTDIIDPLFAEVGTAVEYAPHVNFGTYKMPARPFFEPAVQVVGAFFKKRLAEVEPG